MVEDRVYSMAEPLIRLQQLVKDYGRQRALNGVTLDIHGGITGLLKVGALGDAFDVPLSAHTAPSVHAHVCCAIPRLRNLEYFHDHARIEQMLFDGALQPLNGTLTPDRSRPGLGITFRRQDAERFVVT